MVAQRSGTSRTRAEDPFAIDDARTFPPRSRCRGRFHEGLFPIDIRLIWPLLFPPHPFFVLRRTLLAPVIFPNDSNGSDPSPALTLSQRDPLLRLYFHCCLQSPPLHSLRCNTMLSPTLPPNRRHFWLRRARPPGNTIKNVIYDLNIQQGVAACRRPAAPGRRTLARPRSKSIVQADWTDRSRLRMRWRSGRGR